MGQITQTAPDALSESPTKRIDSIRNQFWTRFCDDRPLLCHKEKALTLALNYRRGGLVLSPTYDFTIFLGKISGKTADEVMSTAEAEIHGLEFAFPRERSAAFTYLRNLRLLTGYIHEPPRPEDRRGPVPEQLKQTFRDLGLIPK
jgi:hypothetical protein